VWQVKGLYKGATSAFVGVALESSVLFGAYSQAKAALQVGIIWRGVPFTESLTGMS
jgi:solute carrier family 25 carnitine/acylcarnitine transporter 20/29